LSSSWFVHDKLFRIFKITGILKTLGPLRIGAGRGEGLLASVDLPVIRISLNGVETPYIPGSSLKGVLRSGCEVVARSFGIDVCYTLRDGWCGNKKGIKEHVDQVMRNKRLSFEEKRRKLINAVSGLCLICKMFGSPINGSLIYVYDSYPIFPPAETDTKPGIAIDRRTGATARGALFEVEYIKLGTAFSFALTCKNLPNYAVGLIFSTLREINEGRIFVGGFKSRGFGRVEIEIEHVDLTLNGKPFYEGELSAVDDDDSPVHVKNLKEKENFEDFKSKIIEVWETYADKKATHH